jgi:hypothetical protein
MTRLISVFATLWVFTCIPFFLIGHVLLDPSGEYSGDQLLWVSLVQWLALIVPPIALWTLSRTSALKDESD